jgi:hypothetical protein
MQPLIAQHRDRFAPQSRRQIDTVDELDRYFCEVALKLIALLKNMEYSTNTEMRRLFADRAVYDDEPTRKEVAAAASSVTEFYRAVLLLAREVRGAQVAHDYEDVIDNLVSLVGFHLEGVDDFITRLVGFITILPALAGNDSEGNEYHSLALELDPDYVLLNRIKLQIKRLRQPWRRWFQAKR